jgi:hypothetical protein
MGRVYHISNGRRRIAARKGFDAWMRRFGDSFDENTSVRRLDNLVIKYLVRGNEESSAALYELIMGTKGLGHAPGFHYLDSESKMGVTDITLFLLDLARFEAMYRLGWLDDYPLLEVPLVDLILNFQDQSLALRNSSPSLSKAHPLFKKYAAEFEGDRHSFVRRLIPEAIRTFCDMEGGAGKK